MAAQAFLMTDISLRRGEALRIQIRFIEPWWTRLLRAWRERRQARLLAELDAHIQRDIGMDPDSGNPLAVRAQALRQREQRRIAMAQFGFF
jgi:hypothetical protein